MGDVPSFIYVPDTEYRGTTEHDVRRRGEATGRGWLAARALRGALAACLLAAGPAPAAAGVVEERIERPTIPTDTRLYVPFFSFFTADSDEAVLTLAHPADDCAAPAEPCMSGGQCASGVCRNALCRYPESVQVGYVAVLRKSRFCDIAACAPGPPPAACTTGVCDGGSCGSPSSNVSGLCLCDTCTETDPVARSATFRSPTPSRTSSTPAGCCRRRRP